MADNKLKMKAIANYQQGMGWYAPAAEEIVGSHENNEVIKHQEPNPRKKFVKVGKAKVSILGE